MKKNESGDKARVKFRYIDFEVEGGTQAIHDGLKQIASALTQTTSPTRALPRPADSSRRTDVPVNGEFQFGAPPEASDAAAEIDVTPETPSSDPKPARQRKAPEFTVINGLNLDAGDGYPSLEDFAKQKGADNHHARYLVSAVWFHKYGGLKEFTANHAYTVYKRLGWGSPPTDAGQPLRELKKRDLIDSTPEKPGSFTVNDAGFDRVKGMGGA